MLSAARLCYRQLHWIILELGMEGAEPSRAGLAFPNSKMVVIYVNNSKHRNFRTKLVVTALI